MVRKKVIISVHAGLQDGMLAYYLIMAGSSDVNVEDRIKKEPFLLTLKDDGTVQHNMQDKPPSKGV